MAVLIPDLLAANAPTSSRPTVATIGVFDGVHIGHQRLIAETVHRARERNAAALAVVFHPRPAEVLRPELPPEYLTPLDERLRLIGDLGCDLVARLRFDRDVAALHAEDFTAVLVERYRLVELCVGPDFALGRGRAGTVPVLRVLGERRGFTVTTVEPVVLGGQVVSSTAIRRLLAAGEVREAATLLGRRFALRGEVVHGFERGRAIGLPTANVALAQKLAVPANGVYAVRCRIDGGSGGTALAGVANIGHRPTFDGGARTLEVHLLDFAGDLYGTSLRVEFVERLRAEERFPNLEAFLAQVQRDIARAREVLGERARP